MLTVTTYSYQLKTAMRFAGSATLLQFAATHLSGILALSSQNVLSPRYLAEMASPADVTA